MPDQAAKQTVYRAQVPAISTVGNTGVYPIKVTEGGVVSSVSYVPAAAQSGANTNSRTLNVVNKAQDGTGSTNVAGLALVSGVNLVAFDEKAVTLNATPANLVVAAGDILQFQSLAVGTGIADPGGEVEIVVTRTA